MYIHIYRRCASSWASPSTAPTSRGPTGPTSSRPSSRATSGEPASERAKRALTYIHTHAHAPHPHKTQTTLYRGVTPNPDVLCNREIKFAHFLRFAVDRLQAPLIATGHYAQLAHGGEAYQEDRQEEGRPLPQLLAGVDEGKDQSYFLSHVPTDAFCRVLFPLGGLRKAEVRVWLDSVSIQSFPFRPLRARLSSCPKSRSTLFTFHLPQQRTQRTQSHHTTTTQHRCGRWRKPRACARPRSARAWASASWGSAGAYCVLRGYIYVLSTRRGSCAPLSPIITIIITLLP